VLMQWMNREQSNWSDDRGYTVNVVCMMEIDLLTKWVNKICPVMSENLCDDIID
jgi:hypothetical protein